MGFGQNTMPGNIWAQLRNLASQGIQFFMSSGPPTNGTSGTGANVADIGSVCWDETNGRLYINRGSKASPTWFLHTISGNSEIVSADLSSQLLKQAEISLTNAQVLNLRATPITLVAAPGVGAFLEFLSAVLFFDRTAAYTETADNLQIKYVDGSGTAASQAIEMTGFIDAAADAITNALPKIDVLGVKTLFENQPLVIHNIGDGEFGGGNAANVIRIKINYRVWGTGF